MFPTIAEYNQTIQKRGSSAFATLSALTFIASRTVPVKIFSYGSGSYAVVFKAKDNYKTCAIRCFISTEQENIERYKQIADYLKDIQVQWKVDLTLLDNEINVNEKYYPVLKMDWAEGKLFNEYIASILQNNNLLTVLQGQIVELSKSLEENQIGHGDIQCGNMIVQKDINNQSIIKLIDYDGLYIPAFKNKINLEKGRSEFQHPLRQMAVYDEKIDRFSFWVILCALEAIKFDKSLWLPVMQGGYNTLDNLLFTGNDFTSFSNSKLVNHLYALNQPSLSFYLNKLNRFCSSSPSIIEPPIIYNVNAVETDNVREQSDVTVHDKIEILSSPAGASVLTAEHQRLGNTPLQIDKQKFLNQTLFIAYGTEFKPIQIQQSDTLVDVYFQRQISLFQPPPIVSPEPIPEPPEKELKKDYTGVIVVGLTAIVLVVLILLFIQYSQSLNSSIANADSTAAAVDSISPAVVDSEKATPSNITDSVKAAVDLAQVERKAAASENTSQYHDSNTDTSTYGTMDDLGNTAKQTSIYFLVALRNRNPSLAWNYTYDANWMKRGKDWFCSSDGFGGITYIKILDDLNILYQDEYNATIKMYYYVEDQNSGSTLTQKLTLRKLNINGRNYWMITRMDNIMPPVEGYLYH